jgi:hypothetical protein
MDHRYAILIAIYYYIRVADRPGVQGHNLRGCVADVNLVEKCLRQKFGICASQIYKLTAAASEDNQ